MKPVKLSHDYLHTDDVKLMYEQMNIVEKGLLEHI